MSSRSGTREAAVRFEPAGLIRVAGRLVSHLGLVIDRRLVGQPADHEVFKRVEPEQEEGRKDVTVEQGEVRAHGQH